MRGIENSAGEIIKAGCVVVKNNKALLVTDREHKVWSFPKGHAERSESLEQTAVRETLEETGCRVKIVKRLEPDLTYINEKLKKPVRLTLFLAELVSLANTPAEEAFEWVDLARARDTIYPNLKVYLELH